MLFLNIVWILSVIRFIRIYQRTGLKCHLYMSLGGAIALVGGMGPIGCMSLLSDLLIYLVMIPGGILFFIGVVRSHTIESGAVHEAFKDHSILDLILGNVSTPEEKEYKPTIGRRTGMFMGGFTAIIGVIVQAQNEVWVGIYLVIFGLAIFFVSLIENKGVKSTLDS